jgi:carotenoid 1,2-hydratase
MSAAGFRFDAPIARGGYAWWYLDALSDDGAHSLCLIAFIGSVFSPFYAAARRRGVADPLNHCAFNLSLGGSLRRWCMTERGRHELRRQSDHLIIGPSSLHQRDGELRFALVERCCPLPYRIRGEVHVHLAPTPALSFALDRAGHHHWMPLAPRARIEVRFEEPALRWSGEGYLDANHGDRALECDFRGWQWSRTSDARGTVVYYEPEHLSEESWPLAVEFALDGTAHSVPLPGLLRLPRSGWGIARSARVEQPRATRALRTLVDAPFYARTLLATQRADLPALAVHESLSLERFRRRSVQWLLPFRMPRRTRPR